MTHAGELDAIGALAITAGDLEMLRPLSARLSPAYLEYHRIVPVRVHRGTLVAAIWGEASAIDPQALDDLRILLDVNDISLVQLSEAPLRQAIRRAYASDTVTAEGVIAGMGAGPASRNSVSGEMALDDLVNLANEAPVVRLVNLLLLEALERRASDVHLERYADTFRTRYRIDGVLHDAPAAPLHLAAALVSRLKIMADLDIAERRIPQDGRIRLRLQDRMVDVRVSIVPTLSGESVVLRLLDKEQGRVSLTELGMPADILTAFRSAISRPNGMVLATGPTGSGKTTTLYAAVDLIRTGREKILTVEDPVEYELQGVPQVPVNEKVGVTFASALRALLRQDPDVVMVGEIRDAETAEIAVQAALTGHLVLSTLHTNDAAGALTRLLDLGVPPFLLSSTVAAVLAQRLVRRICLECNGGGCDVCAQTGYRGRVGIYELLVMSNTIREAIGKGANGGDIGAIARREGMRSLREQGEELVRAGVTSAEEVLRVTRE